MSSRNSNRFSQILSSIPTDELSNYYKFAVNYGIIDFALHPLDFADTLIRLGYEPFPPIEQETFFNGKTLALPSLPAYVYYLYMIDGFYGLYRGVIPHVTEALINRHLGRYIENLSPFPPEPPPDEPPLIERFTEKNVSHFVQTKFWRLISNIITLHVSYPFHVIAVRTMARFVTSISTEEGFRPPELDETWFDELLRVKDFGELYAGCQARIIREIIFTVISAGAFLTVMKLMHFLQPDRSQMDTVEGYAEQFANSIAAMYTNPFRNASDIMIINKTDIPLGNPPFIEPFGTCWECITNLRQDKYWKGAPVLSTRHYMGPKDFISDRLYPRDTMFGPYYIPQGPQYQRGLDDVPQFLKIYYDVWKTMGAQPGMDVRRLEDIVLRSNFRDRNRNASIALQGVHSFLSERHSMPMPMYLSSTIMRPPDRLLAGVSNPFGL